MFRVFASFELPELGARHRSMEARAPGLRIAWLRGENVATDYGLLHRATPFQPMHRAALTVVLEGDARVEEGASRWFLTEGALNFSDQSAGATEAFAGPVSSYLVLEWDPAVLGVAKPSELTTTRLDLRTLERLRAWAAALEGPEPGRATLEIMAIFRAIGVPLLRLDHDHLVDRTSAADRALSTAFARHLARLEAHPSIEDVSAEVGQSARHVHRRIAALAAQYSFPWQHWRASLHQARMLAALRMVSVGATTELVARKTGFRSPTALCHAFAKAGLPSPGALARSAKLGVLDRWGDFVPLAREGPVAAE